MQLIRRQVELAAAAQDSAAVSRFAGEGIAAVEADRQRLHLPYLQDSYLRDRRLIYVAGMAAARRLDDLELLLERADLVKARGALAWLRRTAPAGQRRDPRVAGRRRGRGLPPLGRPDRALRPHVDRDEIVCDRRLLTEAQRAPTSTRWSPTSPHLRSDATWPTDELPALGAAAAARATAPACSAGKRQLFVSPNGLLHQVPVHALTWQGRPLVEAFAVSYVPNFAALARRPTRPAPGRRCVVGIGTFPAGAGALRTTEQEAAAVAALYPARTCCSAPGPTRAALAARRADGRLAGGAGDPPAPPTGRTARSTTRWPRGFLLADGDVKGTDAGRLAAGADLVVLSACWSAQRAVLGRDGSEAVRRRGVRPAVGVLRRRRAAGARRDVAGPRLGDGAAHDPLPRRCSPRARRPTSRCRRR